MTTPKRKRKGSRRGSPIKRCSSCHVEKRLSEFHKHRDRADGRQAMCKSCASVYQKAYQTTPRGRYIMHRDSAERRGVPFLLDFDSWWRIWKPHWERRGCRSGELVMARIGDAGPYAVGNVSIIAHSQNVKDGAVYRRQSAAAAATPLREAA